MKKIKPNKIFDQIFGTWSTFWIYLLNSPQILKSFCLKFIKNDSLYFIHYAYIILPNPLR
jgi:hypothetical protein